MAKRWVENTASGPRVIGGRLMQPGEGNWVEEGPFIREPSALPVSVSDDGRMFAGGEPQSSWAVARPPGTQPVAELNALIAAFSAAGGGSLLFLPSIDPYVYDDELLAIDARNVSIILSPGVRITRPDPFTLTCRTEVGSGALVLISGDTSKLKTGFYSAQYITGPGIQLATRVSAVSGPASLTMSRPATASADVVLTFHYAHNVHRRSNCTNVKIIAPWGRGTLDGNGDLSPITFDSADALRNCIRTELCTDVESEGLLLKSAHYHGEIGTTNNGRIRLVNIRTERNGFRGLHYHGDSPASTISDVFADQIDLYEDGWKAWTISGDQLNSGLFIAYDAMSRVQVGKVRARRIAGFGVHTTGNVPGGIRSNKVSYESIVCEDVAVPLAVLNGTKSLAFGTVQASGILITMAAATLGVGTSQLPLWKSDGSGYVVGAQMAEVMVPPGLDMAKFGIGQAVYIQDIAGGLDVKLAIWSVDLAGRKLKVFNYNSPTTRPWLVGSDGVATTVTVWTARGPGCFLSGNVGDQSLQDIRFGSVQLEGIGDKPFVTLNQGAGVRYITGLKIGEYVQRDCYAALTLFNCDDVQIGAVTGSGSGNRRTGNDTANTGTLYMQHCSNGIVGGIHAVNKGGGGMTRNGSAEVVVDTACNNIKLLNIVAENTNASATAVQATGTNILLGDPRSGAGVALVPYSTGGTNVSVFRSGLT